MAMASTTIAPLLLPACEAVSAPSRICLRNGGLKSCCMGRSSDSTFRSRTAVLRVRASSGSSAVDASKVTPQADRVLVRLEELPEKSDGGVLLPKSAVKFERYLVGEVVSVGKEAEAVEKGQKVMFSDINAYEVNFGTSEKHCFCKAADLLAIIS